MTRLIKRCNDFGAGGVSVAIGELADGLSIDLDSVPKKYDGLDGTELAISESQERMAVVVDPADVAAFVGFAAAENLQCTPVAVVTECPRLTMRWQGDTIVDLTREFLNSNGAPKYTAVQIPALPAVRPDHFSWEGLEASAKQILSDLNLCSQKGLVERFDASVGAATLLAPFGGAYQLSPSQAMAAKLPVLGAETTTASLMGWGFDPYLSSQSPYHGAACAVVHSLAKVIAAGGSLEQSWLTFQEYFPRTKGDPARWGLPAAALLGAYAAQTALKVAAIGGKDSMSGSFEQLDVPPTLVSFAVSVADSRHVVSTEFKAPGHLVAVLEPERDDRGMPDFASVRAVFARVQRLLADGKVRAAWAIGMGGALEAVCKMGFGNRIGFRFIRREGLTEARYGGFVLELSEAVDGLTLLGVTTAEYAVHCGGESLPMETALAVWEDRLEKVFPYHTAPAQAAPQAYEFCALERRGPKVGAARPRVVIPAFPGTNSEYDTARAFERAGIDADIAVIRNQSAADITSSVEAVAGLIDRAQIVAIPGGFSGGDEPEGSGKFILSFFRSPRVREAVMRLLRERDGLMLGICNGFQALIKLGLVPFGEILDAGPDSPTLTFNDIGRHQALLVTTRVASNQSPWLQCCEVGDLHRIPVSHGEGRFIASETLLAQMAANGQIATQYVDEAGRPTMDVRFNPNASIAAVEGITSPDGRVFGKMGHSERATGELFRNVPGNKDQRLFDGAAKYFR